MTEKSKDYLLKTIVALMLMAFGAWSVDLGGRINVILGSIWLIIGFIIMLVLYGTEFLKWWTQ